MANRWATVGDDVTFLRDGADVRYVRFGDVEVVRRLFVTVRDEHWRELPAGLERTVEHTGTRDCAGTVVLEADCSARSGEVDVGWRATAEVGPDATCSYEVLLDPHRPFAYNRMGLCVLFPPELVAGRPYEAAAGAERWTGRFDSTIGPQLIRDGNPAPLFPAFDRLLIDLAPAGTLELTCEGDLFEVEDQRNWSDGSFKAYCTPLSRPRPQRADPARPIRQRVAIALTRPSTPPPHRRRADGVEIAVGERTGAPFPALGTIVRSGDLGDDAVRTLASLGLEHLRVDLRRPESLSEELAAAERLALRVGAGLAPALFLSTDEGSVRAAADALASLERPPVRVFAFRDFTAHGEHPAVQLRRALDGRLADVPLVGGTDGWFVDLNRGRPAGEPIDGVAWSITPEVHADDSLSLVEGIDAQTDQVVTARSFVPSLQLLVSPVTLRPRYNPNGPDPLGEALDPPPASIDPRQAEPFAAAWTVGSLGALARGGVTAVSYFEAAGPRGLMDDRGRLYPLGEVIARAARWTGRDVIGTRSGEPLLAQAVAVAGEMLVANLTGERRRIRIQDDELELDAYAVESVT
jgi:hypothetical protein